MKESVREREKGEGNGEEGVDANAKNVDNIMGGFERGEGEGLAWAARLKLQVGGSGVFIRSGRQDSIQNWLT